MLDPICSIAFLFCFANCLITHCVCFQITSILGLSASHMAAYRYALQKLKQAKTGVTTSIFNRVYHIRRFLIRPAYLQAMSTYYGSAPKVLPSNRKAAAKEINDLASKTTKGKIKDLVDERDFNRVVMALFGAVYFKGTWLYRFRTVEKKRTFLAPSGEKLVTMMKLRERVLFGSFKDLQVVALPYKDDDYSLIVLQPVKRTPAAVKDLQNALTELDINQLYGQLHKRRVHLVMPRFKVEAKYKMKEYLRTLGINKVFDNDADLTGIIRDGNVHVKNVIQKAMMEVNEEGTTAAAAAVVLAPTRMAIRVIHMVVDRPFLAVVYHSQLKTTLFAALVSDPSE